MPNVLTVPVSGAIYFDNNIAGSSTIPNLTSAVVLDYDGAGGLNITGYNPALTATDRFTVDGANGRLFSVSDALTGVIFSVNDAAGLPIIEVNSTITDVINIGTYGTNALVVSGNNVGIGTAIPTERLTVSGNISASGNITGTNLIYNGGNTTTTPLSIGTNSNTDLIFETNGVERMSFTLAGSPQTRIKNRLTVEGGIISLGTVQVGGSNNFQFDSRGVISTPSNGVMLLRNWETTNFDRLQFGGTTSAFPAIRRNGSGLDIVNAESTNFTDLRAANATLSSVNVSGNLSASDIYSNGNRVAVVVDPVRTTLTGNGILSTFPIGGASGMVNPSALIVAIDGALQEPVADYTVASGSITFTSPLPNGSKAVVISPTNTLQVSQMIPADGSVTSSKLDTNLSLAGNLNVGGQVQLSNQTIVDGDSAMTRDLVDYSIVDFDVISLRDDFIGGIDGDTNIGQLRWARAESGAAGNFRPSNITPGFGVAGLHTGAGYRSVQYLHWDASNVTGSFGFFLASLQNETTKIKSRFQFNSLNTRIDFGFSTSSNYQNLNGRKMVLNYTPVPSVWSASQTVATGEYRRPTSANGRRYYASTGGTTGTTEPIWPLSNSGTVTDGSVVWTEAGNGGSVNWRLIYHTSLGETGGLIVDTGIPAVINTWINVEITYVVSQWVFNINGVSVNLNTGTIPSGNYVPAFCIENENNVNNQLSIDYWGLVSRLVRP